MASSMPLRLISDVWIRTHCDCARFTCLLCVHVLNEKRDGKAKKKTYKYFDENSTELTGFVRAFVEHGSVCSYRSCKSVNIFRPSSTSIKWNGNRNTRPTTIKSMRNKTKQRRTRSRSRKSSLTHKHTTLAHQPNAKHTKISFSFVVVDFVVVVFFVRSLCVFRSSCFSCAVCRTHSIAYARHSNSFTLASVYIRQASSFPYARLLLLLPN